MPPDLEQSSVNLGNTLIDFRAGEMRAGFCLRATKSKVQWDDLGVET